MFLKRFVPTNSESGSALVAVLGVFAIGLILTTLILSSVVSGLGWSTFSRASVQSHASADAGIVKARAGLYSVGNCTSQSTPGVYVSAGSPTYRVTVERNNGAGWVTGCPNVLTSQVRLTSTGTAAAPAVSGVSAGDKTIVQAVFQYLVPGVTPSGVGMYLYNGAVIEANSALDLSEGGKTGLIVKNGILNCDKNNGVINGSILIRGNLAFGGSCTVTGSAVVTGAAALGSGRIGGDLTAGSVSPNPPGSRVGGTYTQSPTVPAIPEWVNLTYTPLDWKTSTGTPYEVQTMPSSCKVNSGNLGGTVSGYPLILNALACPAGITANNNTTVSLTSDVVIFANQFDFGGVNSLVFKSSSSASYRLWFITPDNGPAGDNSPTCGPTQGNFTVKNTFEVRAPISALLYTPCAFDGKNGFTWNGQIYAGQYSYAQNNPSFTFVQVGAAGVNFDGAPVPPTITKPQPGGLISMRDVNNG
ncbi:MAG: hypothetical protein ABIW81_04505 [Terrimesophilobacter sp.]